MIHFTKGDERDAITCTRPDGTTTWSRLAELRAKWAAVPQGGRLELLFEPPGTTSQKR